MRVLLVTGSFPPMRCGVGDYTDRLAHALARMNGIQIAVLTSSSVKSQATDLEVRPSVGAWSLHGAWSLIKNIREWNPDIVHIQYPTQGYGNGTLPSMVPMISWAMRRRVVQTWHEAYSRHAGPRSLMQTILPGGFVSIRPGFVERLHPSLRWTMWNKHFAHIRNASAIPRSTLDARAREMLRSQYLRGQTRLLVFFGFLYPEKRAEQLFEIADPSTDRIVFAGELDASSEYGAQIQALATSDAWQGKVSFTGYLSSDDVAALLAAADAVVLPFKSGAGAWNTSVHAAFLQGTLVVTTTTDEEGGYDSRSNIYRARIGDVSEMAEALEKYSGRKRPDNPELEVDEWRQIALQHVSMYNTVLGRAND